MAVTGKAEGHCYLEVGWPCLPSPRVSLAGCGQELRDPVLLTLWTWFTIILDLLQGRAKAVTVVRPPHPPGTSPLHFPSAQES